MPHVSSEHISILMICFHMFETSADARQAALVLLFIRAFCREAWPMALREFETILADLPAHVIRLLAIFHSKSFTIAARAF
jgi:hypothetical protein